jgi:hypothetical protein
VEASVEEGERPFRHGGSEDVHDGEVARVEGTHGLVFGGAHPQASDALHDTRTTQSGLSVSMYITIGKKKKKKKKTKKKKKQKNKKKKKKKKKKSEKRKKEREKERKKGKETRLQKYRHIGTLV